MISTCWSYWKRGFFWPRDHFRGIGPASESVRHSHRPRTDSFFTALTGRSGRSEWHDPKSFKKQTQQENHRKSHDINWYLMKINELKQCCSSNHWQLRYDCYVTGMLSWIYFNQSGMEFDAFWCRMIAQIQRSSSLCPRHAIDRCCVEKTWAPRCTKGRNVKHVGPCGYPVKYPVRNVPQNIPWNDD